jgi:putative transposase
VKIEMIDKNHNHSINKQCVLLGINRNRLYYRPQLSKRKQELLNKIDILYTEDPTRGQRRMRSALRNNFGLIAGRTVIRGLMELLNISAIYPQKRLSTPNLQHKKYPYLLRNVPIIRVNQVWSTDITYVRLQGGFVYLTAIMDWYSRCVLSWRLSTTLDSRFCIEALNEALEKFGPPEIFNTDQGSQYTSIDFTGVLKLNNIAISMDGKGRALDNVFVERLWRTVKYENIYIKGYATVKQCKDGLNEYFNWYNTRREHSALAGNYPEEVYFEKINLNQAA